MTIADAPSVGRARSMLDAPWWEYAACRSVDADLFCVPDGVPLRRKREQERQAKAICSRCPVQKSCLEEALERDEQHGVWGGMDTSERRQLRRRMTAERRQARTGDS
ncbi:WhiB family transcriptional regulator [Haloactinopolyspora sp.]|uniref:WhiB family transcriptional regulator n=1 Tax=Haloactinopolyspora sp. TaxID=1966353 RepID=UPI002612FE53|nr:WhiB family transcriptional regulator [Haloactinopolyspora sp.]